jgi:predicted permease
MDPIGANFDLPTLSDEMEGLDWSQAPQVDFRMIGPGLMESLDYRLRGGRTFTDADRADAPLVALVNQSLAERFWPGQDPVGRRVQSIWRRGQWLEVVGVVEDTRFYGPRRAPQPELFVPLAQMAWTYMTVAARVRGDESQAERALEQAFLAVDPLLPPQEVFRASDLVDAERATERFYALLLSGFALLALALAAAGVYGTFAYAVRRRTKEMGVRLALGAGRAGVVGGIVGRGVALASLGVAAGLAAAIPAARAVSTLLFGVRPADPTTVVAVALLLLAVTAAACLQPAIRAARLDPASVLRQE